MSKPTPDAQPTSTTEALRIRRCSSQSANIIVTVIAEPMTSNRATSPLTNTLQIQ